MVIGLLGSVLKTNIHWSCYRIGWFGFNGGSELQANNIAVKAMYNTQISAATAFAAWVVIDAATKRAVTIVDCFSSNNGGFRVTFHFIQVGPLSGAIVGLVVITPCSGYVDLQGALAIGCISTLVAWPLVYIKARFLVGR